MREEEPCWREKEFLEKWRCWGLGGLRAEWKDRWPRKDERREDERARESKGWSRDRRKHGEQHGECA